MKAKRKSKPGTLGMPIGLVHAIITITGPATLTAAIDGDQLPPPQGQASWRQSDFGALLDLITAGRTRPARVDVHERDGTVFTDIINATPTQAPTPQPAAKTAPSDPHTAPSVVTLRFGGFQPGEHVVVAASFAQQSADATGTITLTATPADPRRWEAFLIGRTSGTVRQVSGP